MNLCISRELDDIPRILQNPSQTRHGINSKENQQLNLNVI